MTSALHAQRIQAVLDLLAATQASRVVDLGCGEGALLLELVSRRQFSRIVGIDRSIEALGRAQAALPAQEIVSGRVTLMHGSFTDGDPRQARFDAAVMLETIEHVDPQRLSTVERTVFGQFGCPLVVITTPNREYNPLLALGDRLYRHPDHRFEWTRQKFRHWSRGVAARNGYAVDFQDIGPADPQLGAPTQMAVFRSSAQRAFTGARMQRRLAGVRMKSRVLVADSQQALQTVQKIIGELVEVVPAETMLEAEQALQSPLAMVICGIHFDGSNMFQLLGLVRGRFSHIPFIVFRDLPSALDPTFAQSVQISAKLMGALGLIDLYSFRQQYGIEEADRRFRHMVMHALDVGSLQ